MTNTEAKEYLESIVFEDFAPMTQKAILVAIEALEKQIPKKTIIQQEGLKNKRCACCHHIIMANEYGLRKYCGKCGQAFDWTKGDE